ncbi:cortistatin [Rhineura floridana]|uniref:cortistatin n=1 Tax=Rhineura floridana TaxID=261503 RepID=UPI002AC845F6|nr:cortistatin [Rhineura floridana]
MAFLVCPLRCLFLLVVISEPMAAAAAAASLPVPEGLVWKDGKYFQAPTDIKKSELLAFLSGLASWASRADETPLTRQEKVVLSPREERAPLPQPPAWEKAPCKNFFWKTFSSC